MKTKKPAVKKRTIGLDLGDRQHHACVLDAAGEIVAWEVIVNTREGLSAFCARYPGATIVMETGTHSPWISRLGATLGHPVMVARYPAATNPGRATSNWASPRRVTCRCAGK
jgi:hypothetical protein